jgi:hypothetical protein
MNEWKGNEEMSEFSEDDFKNWLAWATAGSRTIWQEIVNQFGHPEKCYRAWTAYSEWLFKFIDREACKP